MNPKAWFSEQLKTGGDAFIWSAKQMPEERRTMPPPLTEKLGDWSAHRHVYHLWNYEHNLAIPAMRLWLGEPSHPQKHLDAWYNEDSDWDRYTYDKVLDMFKEGRDEQITMLAQFSDTAWNETRETIWGEVTLHWVVSKIFQHTMEHGCTIMQLVLFWDRIMEQQQNQQS